MKAAVPVALVIAAAAVALLLNMVLLTHTSSGRDPVGRLSPSSALVHPAAPPPAPPNTIGELPDD